MDSGMSDQTKVKLVWPVAGFFVVIAFGVGLISMAAFDASPAVGGSTAASPAAEAADDTIAVELGDLFIEPGELTAPAGVPLTFEVTNSGKTAHNFAIQGGPATEMLEGGESDTLEADALKAGTYTFICEVQGHADGGMKGTLTVFGEGKASSGDMDGMPASYGMSGMSAQKMAEVDAAVTGSFPAKTEGAGGLPLDFEMDGGVKVFILSHVEGPNGMFGMVTAVIVE